MAPLFEVLRVVNVDPQEHVTVVSTYTGWISGFTTTPEFLFGRYEVRGGKRTPWAMGSPKSVLVTTPGGDGRGGLLYLHEELVVALSVPELGEQQLDGLLALEGVEDTAELPDHLELVGGK